LAFPEIAAGSIAPGATLDIQLADYFAKLIPRRNAYMLLRDTEIRAAKVPRMAVAKKIDTAAKPLDAFKDSRPAARKTPPATAQGKGVTGCLGVSHWYARR